LDKGRKREGEVHADLPGTLDILSETKTQDTLFRSFLQIATISETLLGR